MVKTINLFSFPVYEMLITDPDLLGTIQNDIKLLDVNQSQHNSLCRNNDEDLNFSFYNKELFSWIQKGLDYIKLSQYNESLEFKITECWATKTGKFQKHHIHTHPNSIISGILYLTDHAEASTQFFIPSPWHWTDSFIKIGKEGKNTDNIATVSPEKGKIIFFPSNLKHATLPNLTSTTRYSIAFNTFISGTLGRPSSLLKLDAVSVEDTYRTKS
jgi:uncharacterized protein (TIGR02466 family)